MDADRGTMFVLGAGASIGADRYPSEGWFRDHPMPSGRNFFRDVSLSTKADAHGLRFVNMLDMTFEGVAKIIQQAWKLDPEREFWDENEWANLNVEDVFTFLDIGSQTYTRNSGYSRAFKQGVSNLKYYICLAIMMRSFGQRCLRLQSLFKDISEKDTVVSFNWDPIAETTLEHLGKPHFRNYMDLCCNPALSYRKFVGKGIVLKLHGSVNWAVCRNSTCSRRLKPQIFTSKADGSLQQLSLEDVSWCPECHTSLDILIIPPTSNKIEIPRNSYIHRNWMIAREKLPQISKIAFIGYSFPQTDFYSEWLFRQINFLLSKEGGFVEMEIDVVNPEVMDSESTTCQRYRSIFKGHNLSFYRDLEEYVAVKERHAT